MFRCLVTIAKGETVEDTEERTIYVTAPDLFNAKDIVNSNLQNGERILEIKLLEE
jgi:hypothetical protein